MKLKNAKLRNGKKVTNIIENPILNTKIENTSFSSKYSSDNSSVSSDGDRANQYVLDFISIHSKPCRASLATVK